MPSPAHDDRRVATSREPHQARQRWLGFAAVLLTRVAVFPFAQNFYGDPAMRIKALSAWLVHPIFLRSFVVAHQFGPLHLYLLALEQWVHPDLDGGPRLVSLFFGSLTAFPFFSLTRRRFGTRAAFLSTLALAIYPLHIQTSTTATSEAVFLFFLLTALDALDRACAGAPRWLVCAALAMAAACAVRYDGWLYAPLSCLQIFAAVRRSRLSIGALLGYLAALAVVPLWLCFGNWVDLGDPLFIVHYINADHVMNAQRTSAQMGRLVYALYCLTFWPANLAWELSLPVAVAVALGAVQSLRRRESRGLLFLAAIPALFFTFEGAVLLRFAPLARFTIPTAVLLLPYAGAGFLEMMRWVQPRWRAGVTVGLAGFALATPVFFAARTVGHGDRFAETLRPLSPISNLPPDLTAAASWVRAHGAGKRVEIETNWLYEELPIELYGRGATGAVFTPRDGAAPQGFEPPDLLILPKQSDLLSSGRGRLQSNGSLVRAGVLYSPEAHFGQVTAFARN